jgi:phosphate transport system substrate-binding protein
MAIVVCPLSERISKLKVTRTGGIAGLVVVGAMALSACGSDSNTGAASSSGSASGSPAAKVDCATGELTGAGSSFQAPIQQQWVKDYSAKCAGTQINYQSVGSGAGVQQFTSGTVDFAGSDVALKPAEQTAADARCAAGPAVHIPITAGGVALEYNVSGVKDLQLSPATVAGIFAGTIKTWDAAEIKADNPSAKLPTTPITAFHRSDGSGTTQVVSEFLDSQAKGTWTLGAGKEINWPGGQGAKGSEGVTAGVKQTDGGIGYSEVSFAKANSLSVAKVKNAGGQYAELTAANVSKALDSFAVTGTGNDVQGTVNYAVKDGYPISTVTYVIACGKGGKNVALLKSYLTYAVTGGQAVADSLGFAPLPSAIADKNKTAITALG